MISAKMTSIVQAIARKMDGKREGLRPGYVNSRVFYTFCEVEAGTAKIEFNL